MQKFIWFLLFLYLIAFPFGQLVRIPFQLNEISIPFYITDILVGLIGSVWLMEWARKRKQTAPYAKEILIFLAVLSFSFVFAFQRFHLNEILAAGLYLLRVFAYSLFYFAVYSLVRDKTSKSLLENSLIVVGSALAFLGWIQYFAFPDIRPFTIWGWDEHYMRLVGTFLDPGFTAIIIVFTLMLAIFRLNEKHKLWFLLWAFLFVSLLFTYSRAGYLAFIAGMGVVSILKKDFKIFLVSLLILTAGILLIPQNISEGTSLVRTTSSLARVESWENAVKLWGTSPVFGIGFNFYKFGLERYGLNDNTKVGIGQHGATGSDSSILFILATSGVVGLLLFGHLIFKIVAHAFVRSQDPDVTLLASFGALAVHSLFLNSSFYAPVMGWMAILLAVGSFKERK